MVRGRRIGPLAFALISACLLILPVGALVTMLPMPGVVGYDYATLIGAARTWLDTGVFYPADQLAGPYALEATSILYPPTALYLFVPFVYLPAFLWWAIPIGIVGWVSWRLRPGHLAWPFMALCLAWPPTAVTIVVGNPAIWFAALFALGLLYRWPSVLVFLKPSLLPFAVWGIWDRRWWIAVAVLGLAAIPFGAMWLDWISVVRDVREPYPLLHSVQQVPLLLLPLVAWLGRGADRHLKRHLAAPVDDARRAAALGRGQLVGVGRAGAQARHEE